MSTEKPKTLKSKVTTFWTKYESKIALTIGMILVAVLAFEAGIMKGQNWQQKPLIIEKTTNVQESGNDPSQAQNSAAEAIKAPTTSNSVPQECAFVGSQNSTKYHLPTCQWAKRIKPENMVCFKSEEEAKSRGYTSCSTCVK